VLHLKTASPFCDAAFAQDEDLFPAPKRVHDDGPFFEGGPHKRESSRCRAGWQRGRLARQGPALEGEAGSRGRSPHRILEVDHQPLVVASAVRC